MVTLFILYVLVTASKNDRTYIIFELQVNLGLICRKGTNWALNLNKSIGIIFCHWLCVWMEVSVTSE